MSYIHPTAIIHPSAEIGEGNYIGAYCVIEANVIIGNSNRLESFVSIGTPPEHKRAGPKGLIVIGSDTTLRELVVVQRGTGDRDTTVGSHVLLMDHVHVAHDCLVEDHVTISPNVVLGGHSRTLTWAMSKRVSLVQWPSDSPELRWASIK